MPLEQLIERIMGDARERAEAITAESRRRSKEILSEADARAEELFRRKVEEARRNAEAEKRHQLTLEELEARRGILEEKQSLIQQVFDRAVQAVVSLPGDQYVDLIVRLLVSAAGEEGGEVILSPGDRERFGEDAVARANRRLVEEGRPGNLSLSPNARGIAGGFVLSAGGIETNNSLEAVIASRRDELEMRIVEILFPEGGRART